jgi:hypothetical protein
MAVVGIGVTGGGAIGGEPTRFTRGLSGDADSLTQAEAPDSLPDYELRTPNYELIGTTN